MSNISPSSILQAIESNPSGSIKALAPVKAGDKKYWCQLKGASKSLAISELIQQNLNEQNKAGTYIVICDNSMVANELEEQLRFFSPDINILHFPDREILPYDQFSPHQDIISERLACLYELSQADHAVLFVPINTLMGRLPPKDFIAQHSFEVAVGDEINTDDFRRQLEQANYQHVETVYEHGEFTTHFHGF